MHVKGLAGMWPGNPGFDKREIVRVHEVLSKDDCAPHALMHALNDAPRDWIPWEEKEVRCRAESHWCRGESHCDNDH